MRTRPARVIASAALLVLAACASPDSDLRTDEPVGASPREDVVSALDDPRHAGFPDPLIDLDHLISGGPPPDGIPPIDDPNFAAAAQVDWLDEQEPVLSLTVAGESRAYPLQVMTWHEIVNDTVGGVPVAVTYCPLCNSGVAFHRRVGERLLDFGTSGLLYADNLVMYDRQTESLWPQLTGRASVGELTGTQLKAIPMGVVGWSQFRSAHPEALVLTRETGHTRDYGRNPYAGYDDPDGALLVEPPGPRDPRLPVKERVIGIQAGEEAVALRRSYIAQDEVVQVTVGGNDLVVWHRPGQHSALDDKEIAKGREVGTVGVFESTLGRRTLAFTADGQGFRDEQTGSTWNVLGEAVAGPLEGRRLQPHTHLDTFWFAWVAFQPHTELLG